jgi:uncharacterized membrane protein YraQ (UPF0718 family)/copper chaperone CopZ
MTLLLNVWDVLLELSPWLLLGAVVSGFLHYIVPPGFVQRQLSGPGGVVKAVILGVPLPLRDGASNGAAVGFLVATPQTGVDSVLVSAGLLGWPFALWKVGAAAVTGLVAGWLSDAVSPAPAPVVDSVSTAQKKTVVDAVEHGVDVVRSVWRWLVFGVLVSALLSTVLPADAFASLTTQGIVLAFAAALLVSVPLYVCATASVPIAAALVASGMPTGAALVFLMAGPATNVATLGAVYRTFGKAITGVYLGTIVIGSIGFGLLYSQLFGELSGSVSDAHVHTSWWAIISAIGLSAMLVWYAIEDVRGTLARRAAASSASDAITLDVTGMTCNGCANRLQRMLLAADGVESASVSFADANTEVIGSLNAEQLRAIVHGAGFDASV